MQPVPAPSKPTASNSTRRLVATKTTNSSNSSNSSNLADIVPPKRLREEDKGKEEEDGGEKIGISGKFSASRERLDILDAVTQTEDIGELSIEVLGGKISRSMFSRQQKRNSFWLILDFGQSSSIHRGTFEISGLNVNGFEKTYIFNAICSQSVPIGSPVRAIKVVFVDLHFTCKSFNVIDFKPRSRVKSTKRLKSEKVDAENEAEQDEVIYINQEMIQDQEILREKALDLIRAEDDDVVIAALTSLKNRYKEQVESRFRERVQNQMEIEICQQIEKEVREKFTDVVRQYTEADIKRQIENSLRSIVEAEVKADIDFRLKIESEVRATIEKEERDAYKKRMDMIDFVLDQ